MPLVFHPRCGVLLFFAGVLALAAPPCLAQETAPPPVAEKRDHTEKTNTPASPPSAAAAEPPLPAAFVIKPVPENGVAVEKPPPAPSSRTEERVTIFAGGKDKPRPPDLSQLGDTPMQIVSIDPGIRTPAAVWRRADYAYIAFDRKITIPVEQMMRASPRVTLEKVPTGGAGSIFRFYLPQEAGLRVAREGEIWLVYVTKKGRNAPISLTVMPQPSYALGARLMLPVSKAGNPILFTDPEVGDSLIIVPLSEAGQAVRVPYRYADLEFYPAEQGVVIRPRVENLAVRRQQTQGVEITRAGGLRLSPDDDTGYVRPAQGGAESTYLFDFHAWYGSRNIDFTTMRQRWERAMAESPPGERDRIRFDMARFLFARGHYQEASGLLGLLVRRVPDLENRGEFLSLRGAVHVMMRHPEDAVKDLSHPELVDKPEVKLWLAVAYTRLLQWKRAAGLFAESDVVLEHYPEPYFTRFSVIAAEASLAAGQRTHAANVLDRLVRRHPDMEHGSAAVSYLRGVFLSQAGHLERAQELWTRAARGDDLLYRVRAVISLTDLQVLKGKITPADAAERLERLRFVWRGDDLELDILRRLGKFYVEAGKVSEGLAILKTVLAFLPDNAQATALRKEMASAFRDVFLSDAGKKLSPLDALSLYERFHELAPEGEEGDSLIRALAERMVAVDLLDRAAEILADQARRRLVSTFKSRVGAEAAGIYLLDRNPKAALKILDDTRQPNEPPDLVEERALLRARALSELGKRDAAEKRIADFSSGHARRLRFDIAWRARDWPAAATLLADLMPPANGKKINSDQEKIIIARALAMAMAHDVAGLDGLRARYGAAMRERTGATLFRALTEPESGLPRDLDASSLAGIDLFQDYLEDYRKLKTDQD